MDVTQIERTLAALFIPDTLKPRQLVFWYDERAEFESAFEELTLPSGIDKVKLGRTPFSTKYRVLVEQPATSFLLYAPFAEPPVTENWLLDLQKQAERFSADRAALLFRRYGLHQRSLEGYLRRHLAFFNAKKRTEALDAIGLSKESSEMDLRLAMMCATLGFRVADAGLLLRAVLMAGLAEAHNAPWQELVKYFEPQEFWEVAHWGLGVQDTSTLRDLFVRLALTHVQHDLRVPLPEGFGSKLIQPGAKAYVFVDAWLRHTMDAPRWAALSGSLVGDLGLHAFAASLSPDTYSKVETFEVFDQALIQHVTEYLTERLTEADGTQTGTETRLQGWLSDRKPLYWFETYRHHYDALGAALDFTLLGRERASFSGSVAQLFGGYAERYYQIDRSYRRYVAASDQVSGDVLGGLTEKIERAYTFSFLEPLGEAWSDALQAAGDGWNPHGSKQWLFYAHHVQTVLDRNDREKVFVIVSDALRYEVAADVQASLITELRGDVTLIPLAGVLPSITKLGMASLLPHTTLSLTDKGDVLADGRSTQGLEGRNAVLNAGSVSSLAVGAADLLAMSREEGRAAVQPHRVIYIYHNIIDATGDHRPSERNVFAACERAVDELTQIVRKIANTLNGTNILVTSDHGFLYQHQPLTQHDKVERASGRILDSGRRHTLGSELSRPGGTQTFSPSYLGGLEAQSPRGTLRYAVQGGGAQYVHGGASLQEVCVPLLTYKHVRASKGDDGPSHKVGVRVSTTTRKITNNHFTVRLVQAEPAGGRVRPRQVLVRFVDEAGATITNAYPLNLESAATQATDREYIARLNIGVSNIARDKPYYLVIMDAEDDIEILRETWQINLVLTDDFGDF